MAKGLRSRTKKANRVVLRSKVFEPVEEARKQRLSAKLAQLTSKSQPSEVNDGQGQMISKEDANQDGKSMDEDAQVPEINEMEIDGTSRIATPVRRSIRSAHVHKKVKTSATVAFPIRTRSRRAVEAARARRKPTK